MRLIDADDVDNHIVGSVNLSGCPTINAIPIPEDATNGEVLKKTFPNMVCYIGDDEEEHMCFGFEMLSDEWVNAPYKAESEE